VATVAAPADQSPAWPAWQVPAGALGAWVELRLAVASLLPSRPPCSTDPEAWWSTRASESKAARQDAAVAGCLTCPLLQPCRRYALAAGERDGVWGGLTPAERRLS
jgi:WhiB family redox-sensing transcriptional regulator